MGGPVGPDDPVRAEVRVVRRLAEVAAVGPELAAARVRLPDPVVDPLPDESALQRALALERGEVVREPAVRVAHRVRVLAEDHRAGIVALARPRDDRVERRVHRADDVAGPVPAVPVEPDRALVVERPRGVTAADPARSRVVVGAVAALVPERPEDHARVVLVALDHVLRALEEGLRVARVAADLVVVRVRLDVRLVDRVEAVAVAQVEPVRVVGVVRGADGVDVVLLHQAGVRLHRLARDHAAVQVVVLVAVDAVDQHRLAVHEQATVADLDGAEADAAGDALVPLLDDERVERRLLGRPEPRRADARLQRVAEALAEDRLPARVEQASPRAGPRRSTVSRPSASAVTNTSGIESSAQSATSREIPACHHWSWSSTKLASDQRTTTATSSFGPRRRTRSVTSNSAGVRASFETPTGLPLRSTCSTPSTPPKCRRTRRPRPAAREP